MKAPIKQCQKCNKPFASNYKKKVYCGDECREKAWIEHKSKLNKEKNGQPRNIH